LAAAPDLTGTVRGTNSRLTGASQYHRSADIPVGSLHRRLQPYGFPGPLGVGAFLPTGMSALRLGGTAVMRPRLPDRSGGSWRAGVKVLCVWNGEDYCAAEY